MINDEETVNTVQRDLIAGRYMAIERFAEITRRKIGGLKQYLREGRIEGKKVDGKWLVDWIAYEDKVRNLPDNGKVT